MVWKVKIAAEAQKELKKLDKPVAQRITEFLRQRVAVLEDPRRMGAPLRGSSLGEFWKYRVGDYRLICRIEDDVLLVLVLRLGHRSAVYKRSLH